MATIPRPGKGIELFWLSIAQLNPTLLELLPGHELSQKLNSRGTSESEMAREMDTSGGWDPARRATGRAIDGVCDLVAVRVCENVAAALGLALLEKVPERNAIRGEVVSERVREIDCDDAPNCEGV